MVERLLMRDRNRDILNPAGETLAALRAVDDLHAVGLVVTRMAGRHIVVELLRPDALDILTEGRAA